MPVRYARRPAITATQSRNAVSRFRLPGSRRTRNDSSRRWFALLSGLYCTAAKAADSLFRATFAPRLWRVGRKSSRVFIVFLNRTDEAYETYEIMALGFIPAKRRRVLPAKAQATGITEGLWG